MTFLTFLEMRHSVKTSLEEERRWPLGRGSLGARSARCLLRSVLAPLANKTYSTECLIPKNEAFGRKSHKKSFDTFFDRMIFDQTTLLVSIVFANSMIEFQRLDFRFRFFFNHRITMADEICIFWTDKRSSKSSFLFARSIVGTRNRVST